MQEPKEHSPETASSVNGSGLDNSTALERGVLLLPSFNNDEQDREKFWTMLIDKKKPSPLAKAPAPGTDWMGNHSEKDFYFCGQHSNVVCLRRDGDENGPEIPAEISIPKKLSKDRRDDKKPRATMRLPEETGDEQHLREMTDQLRSLLHIGQSAIMEAPITPPAVKPAIKSSPESRSSSKLMAVQATPKSVDPPKSKSFSTPRPNRLKPDRRSTPKTGESKPYYSAVVSSTMDPPGRTAASSPSIMSTARVPFTARRPQPPPFLPPCFSDDEADNEVSALSAAVRGSESQLAQSYPIHFTNGDHQGLDGRQNNVDVGTMAGGMPKAQSVAAFFEMWK